MGASYMALNLDALTEGGRLVVIGLQGGARSEVDLAAMLRRRLTLIATTLRYRPPQQKAEIVARATRDVLPGFLDGTLRAVVAAVYPLGDAADAHRAMEAGGHFGKLLLDVQGAGAG
jgi:NADPH:quinone reductase-like Zn-dependent oxidoreductase